MVCVATVPTRRHGLPDCCVLVGDVVQLHHDSALKVALLEQCRAIFRLLLITQTRECAEGHSNTRCLCICL